MRLKSLLDPRNYANSIRRRFLKLKHRLNPNSKGTDFFVPGHYYFPLLDLKGLSPEQLSYPHDGPENWEHIDLNPETQRAFYDEVLLTCPPLPFDAKPPSPYRYFHKNDFFPLADAYTLSAIIRKFRPSRIIEVGSGFSSAVMLDTLAACKLTSKLTFIEPYPERLYSLLSESDRRMSTIRAQPVQECPVELFAELEAGDILFIDSSHVAKIGSDVTFLLLRILPKLKPGVLIHFHDVVYPHSYPYSWIYEGRAWNESIFLRAFLAGSSQFEILAFVAFALTTFPELFQARYPLFLDNPGGSIWLRKVLTQDGR